MRTAQAALRAVYKRYRNDPDVDLVLNLARRGLADFVGKPEHAAPPQLPTVAQAFALKLPQRLQARKAWARSSAQLSSLGIPSRRFDASVYDAETRNKMLLFLNHLPAEQLHQRIRDDPGGKKPGAAGAHGIGVKVARAIARVRTEQGGMFTALEQLAAVPGFGRDKLHDVAYTVSQIDAASFGLAAPRPIPGNRVTAIVDGPDLRQRLLGEIAKAQHFIHLQVMLFFSDRWGMEVANALAAKAAQGVQVRVMADGDVTGSGYVGSVAVNASGDADFAKVRRLIEEKGGKAIDTRAESFGASSWRKKRKQLKARGIPEPFLILQDLVEDGVEFNWNATDHRKFMVIDGVTSLVGSFNIGPNYIYDDALVNGIPAKPRQWHDGFIVLEGPISSELNRMFASTWFVRGGDLFDYTDHFRPAGQEYGSDLCTLLLSFPGNPHNVLRSRFHELVAYSVGEMTIQNPYVIDHAFWSMLAGLDSECARRTVIINPWSSEDGDFPFRVSSIRCNMWRPHGRGVRVYDYAKGVRSSHFKIAMDAGTNTVIHGSYNLNNRSAEHDFELCVLVRSETFARQVQDILRHDREVSRRVDERDEYFRRPGQHPSCWTMDLGYYFA